MLLNCGAREDSLKSFGLQGDQPINPKGNQPYILRADVEAEVPIVWPPDTKRKLIGKDPDAGKDGRQQEKRAAKDEMFIQHHQITGREFEQTPETVQDTEVCSTWDCRVRHNLATEQQQLLSMIDTMSDIQ